MSRIACYIHINIEHHVLINIYISAQTRFNLTAYANNIRHIRKHISHEMERDKSSFSGINQECVCSWFLSRINRSRTVIQLGISDVGYLVPIARKLSQS